MAKAVLARSPVDNLVVPVAADPWQKTGLGEITPFRVRYEMTVAAFESVGGVVVSDIEQNLEGPSYTYDLLNALAADDIEYKPIIGADAASALATWYRTEDLAKGWEFIVINRPSHKIMMPAQVRFQSVEMEPVDISSTDIRLAVRAGEEISDRVSPAVESLIIKHRLYT